MQSQSFWLGGLVGLKLSEIYRDSMRDNEQRREREKEVTRTQIRAKLQRDFNIPPGFYEDILESDLQWNPLKFQNLDLWCEHVNNLLIREASGFRVDSSKKLPAALTATAMITAPLPKVSGETYEYRFKGDCRSVYLNAIRVLNEFKYPIFATRPMSEVVAFRTPGSMSSWKGQDMALFVAPAEAELADVFVAGSEHPGLLGRSMTTWGERKRLAKKIFERMSHSHYTLTP